MGAVSSPKSELLSGVGEEAQLGTGGTGQGKGIRRGKEKSFQKLLGVWDFTWGWETVRPGRRMLRKWMSKT